MTKKELRVWQTISKKTILHHNKFLSVENHVVKLPDGRIIPDWAWVVVPDAAIVLARSVEGKFLCFRQTKYAVDGTCLAPVGGMLEPGEIPLDAAKRELLEEMGCEAPDWVNFGSYIVDPNRGVATMHLFLAMDARQVAEPIIDDLEDQEIMLLSHAQLEQALYDGEFKIMAWAALVSMVLNYLGVPSRLGFR